MLNGEKLSCLKCYKEEDAGHNSKRMWETAYWDKRAHLHNNGIYTRLWKCTSAGSLY